MASISFLFWCYFSTLIILTTSQYDSVCLWGRHLLNDRPTNGLYRRSQEQVNGKYYYKMDRSGQGCAGNYYYIFWYADAPNHGWYVGYGSTESFGFGIQSLTVAKCIGTSLDTPADCGNNWAFRDPFNAADPYTTIDSAVSVTAGRCPQLNCETITVSNNGLGACIGTATQTGSNEYTSSSGWMWYFNQPFFQWTCVSTSASDALKTDTCVGHHTDTGLLNGAPAQEWQDLATGQVITYDDSQGTSGTFTCAGTSTTTSFAPTGTFPTMPDIPTPHPTFLPIDPASWPGANIPTAPTSPTVSTPTVPTVPTLSPGSGTNGDDDDGTGGGGGDDDDDDDDGSGKKGSVVSGIDDTLFWIILIILILCCCCCIIAGCIMYRKKKKREQYFDA